MRQNQRNRGSEIRSFVWLAALAAVAAGGWGCSSGSQEDPGLGSSGTSGTSSTSGGKSSTGSTGSGAASSNKGGATGSGEGGEPGAGGDDGTSGSGTTGGAGNGTTGGSGTAGATGTGTTACDNGKDDDGDGLIDGFDPECVGPLDNDESSFATGIPGDNSDPKWQDCFFDGNSGAGDDGCRYATGCLTGELPQTHKDCQLSAACIKHCARLTVNGCDCFGCCTITRPDGSTVDIHEVGECSLANLDDEKVCQRCTKSTQCGNDCGECELCAGKTLADLPAKCTPPPGTGGAPNGGAGGASSTGGKAGGGAGGTTGGTTQICAGGEAVCGPNLLTCTSAEYCSFGCCIPAIR